MNLLNLCQTTLKINLSFLLLHETGAYASLIRRKQFRNSYLLSLLGYTKQTTLKSQHSFKINAVQTVSLGFQSLGM